MIILPFSYAGKQGWDFAHPATSCKEIPDSGHSKGKRGWDSAHPALSCKEILGSGHSKGDGEYWIDPEKSGNPLKVYCDMSRSGGKRMNCFLRHENFNRSISDLVELLLERYGLGYSCFLYQDPYYVLNQNYSRILESDWLSSAGRFEH